MQDGTTRLEETAAHLDRAQKILGDGQQAIEHLEKLEEHVTEHSRAFRRMASLLAAGAIAFGFLAIAAARRRR